MTDRANPPLPGEPDFPEPGQSPDGVAPYTPLGDLRDRLENSAGEGKVKVGALIDGLGETAVTPLVLMISIMVVSPLSGIPGVPTLSALVLTILNVQSVIGARYLWLPQMLRQRKIPAKRLQQAIDWLRKPCACIDRHSQARLRILTYGPMKVVAFLATLAIPLTWPFLEIFPFVTSSGALSLAHVAFGRMTRDGLYQLLGYAMIAGALGLGLWIV